MTKKKALINRSFSTREKGMILALVIVLLGAFYYFMVVQNVNASVLANQEKMDELQIEFDSQQALAIKRQQMEEELAKVGTGANAPEVMTYDNFRNEWDELKTLLKDASSFQLNFGTPVASGETVRRPVSVSFNTTTYPKALSLIKRMQNGPYRCLVNDFGIAVMSSQSEGKTYLQVNVNMTYYETTRGATDLSGLETSDESSSK